MGYHEAKLRVERQIDFLIGKTTMDYYEKAYMRSLVRRHLRELEEASRDQDAGTRPTVEVKKRTA